MSHQSTCRTSSTPTTSASIWPTPGRQPRPPCPALARRYQQLSAETRELDAELSVLVTAAAPDLLELPGVGVQTAGQLLTTTGDNPDRLRSDAAFARLCGIAPIPASSGRTDRHRLNRGGDQWANSALHTIALSRMRWHEPRACTSPADANKACSPKEIMRCLKRLIARQIIDVLRRIDVIRAAQLSLPGAYD
ncbi:transposase [Micromonospora sp. U21]|uniref:transposase n=1 Tax=Micromonospora sp. U21 TaxID=2824899 RepID=UPI001B36F1BC|nr:transposase [Micromonospora sp. U21]MBQ0905422.1 IS110 family transposase [Micromonospora sp. U21]